MEHVFSFGMTPSDLINRLCNEQCPNGYPMTIRSQSEWDVITEAWNQGIDSHLEAITERSKANSRTGEIVIHPDELACLLRRLCDSDSDEAMSLRIDILYTLGIQEI